MKETSQSQPAPNWGQNVDLFLLIKNASVVNLQDTPEDRVIFRLGNTFGFNLLTKFNGLDYVFLGNFGALHGHPIIWRLSKLGNYLTPVSRRYPHGCKPVSQLRRQ